LKNTETAPEKGKRKFNRAWKKILIKKTPKELPHVCPAENDENMKYYRKILCLKKTTSDGGREID